MSIKGVECYDKAAIRSGILRNIGLGGNFSFFTQINEHIH